MAIRFHIVPGERGVQPDGNPARGPKYFSWRYDPDPPPLVDLTGFRKELIDYALEDVFLVAADLTNQQVQDLAQQADVVQLPANLDDTLGATQTAVAAKLEAFNIPSDWLSGSLSIRQLIRGVNALFRVANRLSGSPYLWTTLFWGGVTMNTPRQQMPGEYDLGMFAAIVDVGYSTLSIPGSASWRQVMSAVAQQGLPAEMYGVPI